MERQVLTFGRIRELTGSDLTVPVFHDTDTLKTYLESTYPELKNSKYVMAVNKNLIRENTAINGDTIIALLPPFSGG